MRALFFLIAAVILVDTMFFAAVAPLLPEYTAELDLSKAGAGILTASYAAGALVGSLPAGMLTSRLGVRPSVVAGLLLVAAASIAFAFGDHVVVLDVARFLQGVGGAWMWAGGMAWLVSAAPPERRGELIGAAIGAVVVGVLLGPVIGGAATVLGPEVVFSAVAAVCLLLAAWALATPGRAPEGEHTLRDTLGLLRRRAALAGIWLVLVAALLAGVLEVLAPLRLDEVGASGVAIGAVFLLTAAIEAVLNPLAGRLSDRRGRLFPVRLGLAGATAVAVVAAFPDTVALVAAVVVLGFCALAGLWAPATALISDASEEAGVDQGYAFALMNIAWAIGQMIGSAGGGGLAEAAGDHLPYGIVAAICGGTLVALMARREAPTRPATMPPS